MGDLKTTCDTPLRVLTFRFGHGQDSDTRLCLAGHLMHLEYFSSLFHSWQEASSAEVCITDFNVETFDQMMVYINIGTIEQSLPLGALVKLLEAADKYLLPSLVALVMLHVVRQLQDHDRVKNISAEVAAELLSVSGRLMHACSTLQ